MNDIIIMSAQSRKSFDLYNILVKKNYNTYLCSSSNFFKRFCLKIVYGKNLILFSRKIEEAIKKIDKKKDSTITVFATEEEDIINLYSIKNELNKKVKFLIPPEVSFHTARSKDYFSKFCNKNIIPVPKEFHKSEIINKKLSNNIVLKPILGSGAYGITYFKKNQWINKDSLKRSFDFILQEKIGSHRSKIVTGCFLFKNGNLIDYFGHKRIRTFPMTGGVTLYSKLHNNELIKDLGSNLLKKLNWTGFAMIEFMWCDKNKEYKIIELNPRLWGSMILSEACNSNMITNYIQLCNNENTKKTNLRSKASVRWMIPYDLINLLTFKISLKEFFKFEPSPQVIINISYSTIFRSLKFFIFQLICNEKFINRLMKFKK